MKDDDFLKGLKNAALRDPEAGRAEHWERLALGEANAEEHAALERMAVDEDDRDALDALAPASDAYVARVERAIAHVDAAPPAQPPASVRRVGRLFPRAITIGVGVLAMAAGVALFVGRREADATALPSFELVVRGGQQASRSPSTPSQGPVTLGPDADLRIAIRPEHDIAAPLEVRLFMADGDRITPWNAPVVVSPAGVVQIDGPAKTLIDGGNGPREIVIAIGRPGSVPASGLLNARDGAHDELKVFRVSVQITGR